MDPFEIAQASAEQSETLRSSPSESSSKAAARIPDAGTLEAAKWLGLVSMTIDHINTYLLAGAHPWMYHVGRLAMPLFGMVLAAHLARPEALEGGLALRMGRRLAIAGTLAQVPYTWLRGGPWPPTLLNVLFLLLLVVGFVHLRRSSSRACRVAAWCLLLIGGALVEFWWIGAVVILAFYTRFASGSAHRTLSVLGALTLLALILKSPVPLLAAAFPLIAERVRLPLERRRFAFYLYYPAHLAILAIARDVFAGP